jgi:ribosomal protein S18 acetylase RimI-like enzyme
MDDDEWLAQRFREDGPSGPVTLRSAVSSDARALTELVDAAYRHYVDRIGMLPGPMTQDYADVIATRQTTVAEISGLPVGVLVLNRSTGQFVIENVAVHPEHRGTGLGRALLDLAEAQARRAGFDVVHLFTHEQMTENLAIYTKRGYREDERRSQGTFDLVFMSKRLE